MIAAHGATLPWEGVALLVAGVALLVAALVHAKVRAVLAAQRARRAEIEAIRADVRANIDEAMNDTARTNATIARRRAQAIGLGIKRERDR